MGLVAGVFFPLDCFLPAEAGRLEPAATGAAGAAGVPWASAALVDKSMGSTIEAENDTEGAVESILEGSVLVPSKKVVDMGSTNGNGVRVWPIFSGTLG